MKTKVAVVEDDASIRLLLERIIAGTDDLKCVGLYRTCEEALAGGILAEKPRIVILDLNLPGQSALDYLRSCRPKLPKTDFIIFTVHDQEDLVLAALQAGAVGYLTKQDGADKILSAIREVQAGGAPISDSIARRILNHFYPSNSVPANVSALSTREKEILELLSHGLLYKEIADRLGIGFETVRTHVRRIYSKLEVKSRPEAVAKYMRRNAP